VTGRSQDLVHVRCETVAALLIGIEQAESERSQAPGFDIGWVQFELVSNFTC
jgi:hypothetical protein